MVTIRCLLHWLFSLFSLLHVPYRGTVCYSCSKWSTNQVYFINSSTEHCILQFCASLVYVFFNKVCSTRSLLLTGPHFWGAWVRSRSSKLFQKCVSLHASAVFLVDHWNFWKQNTFKRKLSSLKILFCYIIGHERSLYGAISLVNKGWAKVWYSSIKTNL